MLFSDPRPEGFQVVSRIGTEVIISWYHPYACYRPERLHLFYDVGDKEIQKSVETSTEEYKIVNLRPEKDYVLKALVEYEGDHRSDITTFKFNSGECAPDTPNCKLWAITI